MARSKTAILLPVPFERDSSLSDAPKSYPIMRLTITSLSVLPAIPSLEMLERTTTFSTRFRVSQTLSIVSYEILRKVDSVLKEQRSVNGWSSLAEKVVLFRQRLFNVYSPLRN